MHSTLFSRINMKRIISLSSAEMRINQNRNNIFSSYEIQQSNYSENNLQIVNSDILLQNRFPL